MDVGAVETDESVEKVAKLGFWSTSGVPSSVYKLMIPLAVETCRVEKSRGSV